MINGEPDLFVDLIMPRDRVQVLAMADELGIDVQAECQALYGCAVESLSQCHVADLREHLRSLVRMANVA